MLPELAAMVATDSDAKELDRQRILLCITKAEIETIQRETCGRLFQTVSPPAVAARYTTGCMMKGSMLMQFMSYSRVTLTIRSSNSFMGCERIRLMQYDLVYELFLHHIMLAC